MISEFLDLTVDFLFNVFREIVHNRLSFLAKWCL